MAHFKLFNAIIDLSVANNWEQSRIEWSLDEVYFAEEPETCLCGHFPILELCILVNRFNKQNAIVGNCCVKKFLELPSDKIFEAVKRIKKDEEKSLNQETIDHAFEKKWINEWERDFYADTFRKRKLSDKQLEKKVQINRKVIGKMNKK